MKNQTKKSRSFNHNKRVRMNINLNKANPVHIAHFTIANDEWAKNCLDQFREIYSDHSAMNYVSNTNNKLIIEWWEN